MSRDINTGDGEIGEAFVTIPVTPGVDTSSENAADYEMCLGGYKTPTSFLTPDVVTHNEDGSVLLTLYVGNGHTTNPPTGRYWTTGRHALAPLVTLTYGTELLRITNDGSGVPLPSVQPWATQEAFDELTTEVDGKADQSDLTSLETSLPGTYVSLSLYDKGEVA